MSTGKVSAGGVTSFLFSTPVTSAMAPNARIVLYYVRSDGEIVTDSISFDVDGAFKNQVRLLCQSSDSLSNFTTLPLYVYEREREHKAEN